VPEDDIPDHDFPDDVLVDDMADRMAWILERAHGARRDSQLILEQCREAVGQATMRPRRQRRPRSLDPAVEDTLRARLGRPCDPPIIDMAR
jgi:hypothetical protein